MKLAALKKFRVIISLIFFLFTSVLFLDFSFSLTSQISNYVLYLQFIPSFLKFINVFSVAAAGFIIVLVLTILFGRIYCSTICPLGVFQDFVSYFSKKLKKRKRYNYAFLKAYNPLRYSLLVVTILSFLAGSLFAVNLLDPYSNFGRIMTGIFRPIFLGINNSLAFALNSANIFWIFPVEFKGIDIVLLVVPVVILVLVLWLSFTKGRLYCNTVCPVGTLLGFLSKFAIFKIVIDEVNCKGCGVCEKVCKAGCIETETKFVDFTRCVGCFNCFDSCPTNGLEYKFVLVRNNKKIDVKIDYSKRDFIAGTLLYTLGLSSLAFAQKKIEVYKENTVPVVRKNPICPPGSKSIDYFTDACTACHLCVSSCPTQVLQPSFLEYGFLGMLQPRMDNKSGFCNFECKICGDICPNGAILPVQLEEKKLIQIGKVKFVKENCVVETQGTDCGACSEHCPTKAVNMVQYSHLLFPGKNLKIPETNDEICIGCGACEFACPTIPYKAIYVESNPVHQKAKKPKVEELEPVDTSEDFPF